ncbi:hypothetical protein ABZ915_19645 [Streptomyces sp. NPDC046915]|uniref:hypothetical protein n=1 Tax=Streptomyces sp. NPDC046915 TaxID=3155257 RepID=UPI00340D055C
MTDRDWYDDAAHRDAVRRAERATRFGWAAVTGLSGLFGCALTAVAVVLLGAVVACGYVVVSAHYP